MKLTNTIKDVYAAFGRGDVPAILEHLADDVEWDQAIGPNEMPWLQPRRGRAAVAGFFQAVGTELEFHAFTPTAILEGPGVVVALCDLECTVKKTGKRIHEVDEAHIWRFDAAGRVIRFRHGADTLAQALAWKG